MWCYKDRKNQQKIFQLVVLKIFILKGFLFYDLVLWYLLSCCSYPVRKNLFYSCFIISLVVGSHYQVTLRFSTYFTLKHFIFFLLSHLLPQSILLQDIEVLFKNAEINFHNHLHGKYTILSAVFVTADNNSRLVAITEISQCWTLASNCYNFLAIISSSIYSDH